MTEGSNAAPPPRCSGCDKPFGDYILQVRGRYFCSSQCHADFDQRGRRTTSAPSPTGGKTEP